MAGLPVALSSGYASIGAAPAAAPDISLNFGPGTTAVAGSALWFSTDDKFVYSSPQAKSVIGTESDTLFYTGVKNGNWLQVGLLVTVIGGLPDVLPDADEQSPMWAALRL